MCFFKNLKVVTDQQNIFDKDYVEQSSEVSQHENTKIQFPNISLKIPTFECNSYLVGLSELIRKIQLNNLIISNIQKKFKEQIAINPAQQNSLVEQIAHKPNKDEVLCKLFGDLPFNITQSSFKFKLSLSENIPSKFYKHRKFALNVKLVPCTARSSKIVLNSNPLDVCIGVFDKDGNWVNQNLLANPILDGLTQVSLYQGKAQFSRLLFNQISSNLPKQKLNLAIYVKPSMMNSWNESNSGVVDWKSIKPLILKNVCVLSKKRKKMSQD